MLWIEVLVVVQTIFTAYIVYIVVQNGYLFKRANDTIRTEKDPASAGDTKKKKEQQDGDGAPVRDGGAVKTEKEAPVKKAPVPIVNVTRPKGKSQSGYKMVLCVRTDLEMGKGKMCAQVGHATLGVCMPFLEMEGEANIKGGDGAAKESVGEAANEDANDDEIEDDDEEEDEEDEEDEEEDENNEEDKEDLSSVWKEQQKGFQTWLRRGQAKIAVKCPSEEEMLKIRKQAKALHLPTYTVHDAGHTQVVANSKTVLAVGPGPALVIDQVCGHLKLL